MERPRYMTFDIKNYDSELSMMVEVGNVLAALARNDYECLFYYEDCGIYVLKFADKDRSLGTPYFAYITEDDELDLDWLREHRENENEKEGKLVPSIDELADTCDACQIDTPTAKQQSGKFDKSWKV